jgi:hypothetical protein
MIPRFTIASLLVSTAFFAAACWMVILPSRNPEALGTAVFYFPAAIGGAIGALYGKTAKGIFCGFVFVVSIVVASVLLIAIMGLVVAAIR